MFIRLAALGALGYAGYRYLSRQNEGAAPAYAPGETRDGVRNSGPGAIRDETGRSWSEVDEEIDQSFPASDPPANY
jgi:hypothetical protein